MNTTVASVLGAFYAVSEIALSIRKRAGGSDMRLADRGSLLLLWVVIVVSMNLAFSMPVVWPAAGMGAARPAALAAGVVFFVMGLALRWYAISYLGRFFTVNVAIASDHRLIDRGPYRLIRHPSYSGALMAFLGVGLCCGNWASIACTVLPIFLVFLYRMRVEESALLQGLGTEYRDYMQRTRRLIPAVY